MMEQIESVKPKVKHLFSEYARINKINERLRTYIKSLSNENTHLRENLKRTTEKLHETINKNLNEDIHLLYINLRDKYEQSLKETENVKQEKEILVKHYEEKILIYKDDVVKEKTRSEVAESVFNEKLQVHQASAALQNDELESNWQARLDIVNQQLKDSNMSCNILRNQLVDLKNRFSFNNTESDTRIQHLEHSLTMSEEKLRKAEEKLMNKQHGRVQTFGRSVKPKIYPKTRPYSYDIGQRNFHNQTFPNHSFDSNTSSRHYEPLPVNNLENMNRAAGLNKTIPQNEIEMGRSPRRIGKRKLYNADDFTE